MARLDTRRNRYIGICRIFSFFYTFFTFYAGYLLFEYMHLILMS